MEFNYNAPHSNTIYTIRIESGRNFSENMRPFAGSAV